MKLPAVTIVLACLAIVTGACAGRSSPGVQGAYGFADGRLISVRQSTKKTVRYRVYQTGESRRLHPERGERYVAGPSFADRSPVQVVVRFEFDDQGRASALTWEQEGRPRETARRVNQTVPVAFSSDGARLVGRLDLPDAPGPHPAVVLVHGSGNSKATDYFYNGDFLAANGIATLIFDKRGTGGLSGRYTFDFHQLARDVVAAVQFLKGRDDIDPSRIGLSGYSQGGWVAPLAASMSDDVRFVLVSCGMIESPAEEARMETREELRKRGVDEASLEQVDELTLAAVHVVASGFESGWEQLAALKKKHRHAPWRKQLSGTTVAAFVKYPPWLVKLLGPRRAPSGLDWYYNSVDVLENLSIPMLWLLGEEDESAPNEATIPKLRDLEARGKPHELVVFQGADHNMLLFEQATGERIYTGYAPDYFQAEVAGARRLAGLD